MRTAPFGGVDGLGQGHRPGARGRRGRGDDERAARPEGILPGLRHRAHRHPVAGDESPRVGGQRAEVEPLRDDGRSVDEGAGGAVRPRRVAHDQGDGDVAGRLWLVEVQCGHRLVRVVDRVEAGVLRVHRPLVAEVAARRGGAAERDRARARELGDVGRERDLGVDGGATTLEDGVDAAVEALEREKVPAPFGVDDVAAGALRHVAAGLEGRAGGVRDHVRIAGGVGVVVGEDAERLVLEVGERQRPPDLEHESRPRDPVPELLRIGEVRPPRDVPGEGLRSRAHGVGRPVDGLIPDRRRAVPGLGVEPADVLARPHTGAPGGVGQHAHEAVAGGEVDARPAEGIAAHRVLGGAVRDVIGLGDGAAEPVARGRLLDEAMGKGRAFEAEKQQCRRQCRPCRHLHEISSSHSTPRFHGRSLQNVPLRVKVWPPAV